MSDVDIARQFRDGVRSVNARDWIAHRRLIADEYRFVDYGNGLTLTNAEDYIGYQEHSMTPFPDEQLTIKKLLVDAINRADESPLPDPATVTEGVFATPEDLDTPHHK